MICDVITLFTSLRHWRNCCYYVTILFSPLIRFLPINDEKCVFRCLWWYALNTFDLLFKEVHIQTRVKTQVS